ncbi:MAG: 3-dehydroquinate synthase [Verrucomicrobia bacterium]|nr:MAG: 3-dehydroquinate synthase [Verrucomicrobiota bacterium]
MYVIKVPLGVRSYTISIGNTLLEKLGPECKRLYLGQRCAVFTDRNVAPRYSEGVLQSLKTSGFEPTLITVPAGETAKSLKVAAACYDRLAEHGLERKSFVVALGGGVVGDLAGFVAATFLRGIDFVQIPTTLLALVDSSVGGKVGVNLKAGKNLVGAFWQPRFVLCDLDTLETLPVREYRAGLAEIIKYGVIHDVELFKRLEQAIPKLLQRDPDTLSSVVARCCQIKAGVVGQDETESGLRAILNFGHTLGHALEAVCGYGKLLHGEAIAIGQVFAARLSAEMLGFPQRDVERIAGLFEKAGLQTHIQLSPAQREKLLEAMRHDKKVSQGAVKFVLVNKIGQVSFGQPVPLDLVEKILAEPAVRTAGAESSAGASTAHSTLRAPHSAF